jgi:hypothetical protein
MWGFIQTQIAVDQVLGSLPNQYQVCILHFLDVFLPLSFIVNLHIQVIINYFVPWVTQLGVLAQRTRM